MAPRITNPTLAFPQARQALLDLRASVDHTGIPSTTRCLVEVRASQINGCSVCVDMHTRELMRAGEPDERIHTIATWRDAPYFTAPERAALALAEAATRLADRPDPVPDPIWDEAARHYTEPQLGALVIAIATINAFNRLQAVTGQISGEWVEQVINTDLRPR